MTDEERNDGEGAPSVREGLFYTDVQSQAEVAELIRLGQRATEPNAVFSTPVIHDNRVVITASEVAGGIGVGFGSGGDASGQGTGGGGGGGSFGRPVALVVIEPEGVRVEPVFDVTKLGIAFFTTLGAMFLGWRAMRRFGR